MDVIKNHNTSIPNAYKKASYGINKLTGIPKLFRGLILGPSGSGKTNLIFDLIKRSPNIYSKLHLIVRNADQPIYNFLKDKLGDFCIIYGEDNIPRVDDIQERGLQLVIIDDFSNDEKLQKNVFAHYFTRGRHKGLSTVFLSHSYFNGTYKMIRLNVEIIMILKANSKRDLSMILKDFAIPGVTNEILWKAYLYCTSQKGQFLQIDCITSTIKKNFLQPIDIQNL